MLKLQVAQFAFIIFAIILFLLSLYLSYFQFGKRIEEISNIRTIDIFENIKHIIDGYAKLSLYYATTQNFREESHTWIHNGFNPLEFEYLKDCKQNWTTFFFNQYLSKFRVDLPVNIEINSVKKCFFDLEKENVFKGLNDEGNFSVFCNSTNVKIYINETFLLDFINSSNFITNNRYWYLYRKFYEWARENADKFASCVCGLVKSCATCNSIEICYRGLLESLKAKFKDDEYVECYTDPTPCCYQEHGDLCRLPDICQSWQNRCYVGKNYECPQLEENENKKSYSNNYQSEYLVYYSKNVVLSDSQDYITEFYCTSCIWQENRMETHRRYYCIDYKYYESSPSGPKPLEFTAIVYAGWKNYVSCISEVKNKCENKTTECKNCNYVNGKLVCDSCKLTNCEKKGCVKCWLECKECEVKKLNGEYEVIRCKECESKPDDACPK
ncbi:MAG: hypothetical protein QW409_03865 [Candidatus Aenigmatarchaeota archaeon]